MALFKKTKSDEAKAPADKKDKKEVAATTVAEKDYAWVLKKTRITEKATITPEKLNAYVFDVNTDATKDDIKEAVRQYYKVTPVKVNVTRVPSKKVTRRRRTGVKHGIKTGGKKAYVYLKKGDKIEFV